MLIQIKEENDILLMYQMTEPCTKIIKHDLQSSFLTVCPNENLVMSSWTILDLLHMISDEELDVVANVSGKLVIASNWISGLLNFGGRSTIGPAFGGRSTLSRSRRARWANWRFVKVQFISTGYINQKY